MQQLQATVAHPLLLFFARSTSLLPVRRILFSRGRFDGFLCAESW